MLGAATTSQWVVSMAFENVSSILQMGSVFSSFKLLLIAASSSRPQYRSLCFKLLQPFTKDGEVSLRYRCYHRYLRSSVRLSELRSDLLSVLELSVRDTYRLDLGFQPDLVIDGGGNIGLFTLRAAAAANSTNGSPVKFVVCEPLPRNIKQIQKHIDLNQIPAEILPVCLGGVGRQIPFYCREAIDSSFDPHKPYLSTIDIPVYTLRDALGSYPAKRILIKLDIEGMEIEALESYVPGEQRAVYIVGELHGVAANASVMKRIFHDNGWRLELHDIANNNATFRACSPAAAPLLAWAAGAQSTSPAEGRA
ncbi:MAG: FkbM family methyltransferase [Acidobacteriales bacterium]|nr:FkbM family methyltransferase [Terriglobales bacterium]